MTNKILCLKVPKQYGEQARSALIKLKIFDQSHKIAHQDQFLLIPLVERPSPVVLAELKIPFEIVEAEVEPTVPAKERKPRNLIEALENKLTPFELAIIPVSYDIVGDIAIIEIPEGLMHAQNLIAKAVFDVHPQIRVVAKKVGAVGGEFRVREAQVIAGETRTTTIHKEYGCRFKVDINKVYFSPRLATEHKRVASQVRPGETIVDMFAGIGPFSILIAKSMPIEKIYAIDKNPVAVEFLKENIKLNKVEGRVIPFLGDTKKIIETKLKNQADRVIMNLPHTAFEFLDSAISALKPAGGVIHYYEIGSEEQHDIFERAIERITSSAKKAGREIEILHKRIVRPYAPYEYQIAVDALLNSYIDINTK